MRNASPPETASVHSTNAEQHQQKYQHQHQNQQQAKNTRQHQHQQQQHQQQQTQQHHHVHCSYDKDIVCDDTQAHLQQLQQQQQHQLQQEPQHGDQPAYMHCHSHIAYAEPLQQSSSTPTPHRHQQQQRKHSHSPHHSRHTSPHSHHSHSQHSSPHQSHHHMHEADSLTRSSLTHPPRPTPNAQSTSSHHHQHHQHNHRRRRSRHGHQQQNGNGNGNGNTGGGGGGSGNSSLRGAHGHSQHSEPRSSNRHHSHVHGGSCTRRHRSATDISSTSLNTCHDPTCVDREVQEILVRKTCCNSSRTELAQYFAEDLYGSTRRPSSCCTSSDYCYQTDSTSLYGSRSSLSRNNSIKSASVALRKRRLHQRQPSYTSISLRSLNAGRPSSQPGSLTSVFDRAKQMGIDAADLEKRGSGGKIVVSPSKVTIERQTSKDALSNDLPEYACSPSPIRWSFLADGKSPTEFERAVGEVDAKDPWTSAEEHTPRTPREPKSTKCEHRSEHRGEHRSEHRSYTMQHTSSSSRKYAHDERPSTSAAAAARKRRESPLQCDFEETSTTVLFHQEADSYNNCCNNYIQCNTYLDQDLQITSEDIHQYLSKGNQQSNDVLNNSKNYPFQPSNALEFQYKNNFANNNTGAASSEGGDSVRGYELCFRRNSSKETNLNQNSAGNGTGLLGGDSEGGTATACTAGSCSSTPLSPTNINLSSSTNNINIVFGNYTERNANEVKFINTTRSGDTVAVSTEAHHSGYLPYTYPSYDYTNMSANSQFDKPLGIGELPKDFASTAGSVIASGDEAGAVGVCSSTTCGSPTITATSDGQHSSLLQSPVPTGVSFESFDAASDHNLISCRGSCQFSPTPRSPLSPASPASSSPCLSASINPAAASYVNTHHPYFQYQTQGREQTHSSSNAQHSYHHYNHSQYHQHHQHFTESFKISNAFKKVRKRARKYTDFLRKK